MIATDRQLERFSLNESVAYAVFIHFHALHNRLFPGRQTLEIT